MVALVWPSITALVLLYVVAIIWAILSGVAEMIAAVSLRREFEGEWALSYSSESSLSSSEWRWRSRQAWGSLACLALRARGRRRADRASLEGAAAAKAQGPQGGLNPRGGNE
jgi:Short repeat of unknown function (DUF308)